MTRAVIQADFWHDQLEVNASQAIFHQWQQLEASGCINNFRIAAGVSTGLREGWFFADSDAYKWLDAAARIWAERPDPRLSALMDGFILLLAQAQQPDGYLFTYNQIFFPGTRWQNLQIEHELYCHGHLIEAGVSHYEATGRSDLLQTARLAADRIVTDFRGEGPDHTPGHEEIEIALLRLHAVTPNDTAYLALARQFLEQRGRSRGFALSVARQNLQVGRRTKIVEQRRADYLTSHPETKPYRLPPGNQSKKPRFTSLRWYASALSGKYFQQHAPLRHQPVPVGHAVRFAYLQTAAAMLMRETGERSLLPTLEQAWQRMITRRMYVTGGIGSLPGLEGFGRDYELDPDYAYAETCAALGSLFWNWEMAQLDGKAQYSDLFEWQLYNAAAVGFGLDGRTYLYNNPLACRAALTRQPWFAVPCCPSNLSRTWADLGKYIYSVDPGQLTVHQYISSQLVDEILPLDGSEAAVSVEMHCELPWQGRVSLKLLDMHLSRGVDAAFTLRLRRPSWAGRMRISINGIETLQPPAPADVLEPTASGYDPRQSVFVPITRSWLPADRMEIEFDLPVRLLRAHPRVKGSRGMAAVTHGPLVYCLESVDNPGVDIFNAVLDAQTLEPDFDPALLGGVVKIKAHAMDGTPLTFIPYFRWGNRGPSSMTVWVNTGKPGG